MTLAVSEVFGPTIQGEGPTAGRRAGFVRLARCNLECRWCDTAYTWDWERFDPAREVHSTSGEDVLAAVGDMGVNRVVVTGGEPLLQQEALVPLVEAMAARGWAVEIETNGTVAPSQALVAAVERFNVSPKLANSGMDEGRRLRPAALGALRDTGKAAFKFVVTADDPARHVDEVAAVVERFGLAPVWLMPEGTTADAVLAGMRALTPAALERGWHVSSRLHILLWGDCRGR